MRKIKEATRSKVLTAGWVQKREWVAVAKRLERVAARLPRHAQGPGSSAIITLNSSPTHVGTHVKRAVTEAPTFYYVPLLDIGFIPSMARSQTLA